jgi:endoglucanase
MDYELCTKPPGWEYWQAIDRGEKPSLPRVDNPIWRTIRQHLKN